MDLILKKELSRSYTDMMNNMKSSLQKSSNEIMKKIQVSSLASCEEVLKERENKGFSLLESCEDILDSSRMISPKSLNIIKPVIKSDLSNEVFIE